MTGVADKKLFIVADNTKDSKAGRPSHVSGNIIGSRQSNTKESVEFR